MIIRLEPVIITINTLEFIATIKTDKKSKESTDRESSDKETSLHSSNKLIDESSVSTNYLQSIVNKIILNLSIVVNNLIIKLVEDDIVLSLNIKSIEGYSVDSLWNKTFLDVNADQTNLRKLIKINDLTVCLDRRDASGKIEFYQDPLIFRWSVEARLHLIYKSISLNKKPDNFYFQFYCKKLPISITDQQLMMILRFVQLFNSIYDNTSVYKTPASPVSNQLSKEKDVLFSEKVVSAETNENSNDLNEANSGWYNWAWSYLPSFATNDEDENQSVKKSDSLSANIGFYCDEISICLKVKQLS